MEFARNPLVFFISIFVSLMTLCFPLDAQAIEYPQIPKGDIFILDQANMISEEDENLINSLSLDLRNQKSVPIIVVTIPSLVTYKAEDLSIEAYARALFDEWGIGRKKYNYGILLLVSQGERKARIELGAEWAGTANSDALYIMDEIIVPQFKVGKFSSGIRDGAMAMDSMARGKPLPSPFYPKWLSLLIYLGGGLVVCGLVAIGVSLIKSGNKGKGWAVLSVAVMILMFLVRAFLSSSKGGFSSGGFSGGGTSGGGGATGSW